MPETQGGIVAQGVSRSFGAVRAVRDASFEARAGRVTGLIGPNGAGKTTLLLMLASLLAPDAGTIRIGDVDPVQDPSEARKLLGWMPDALGAWPALTTRETLVTTGRLHDLDRDAAQARAVELIEMVGLHDLADAPARVLSRGQKQKLGLARALVHKPRVLLLDEPASGLDPHARVQLRTLLRDLAATGCTILISSHVLSELEELIDDAVYLVAGQVVDAPQIGARARPWRIRAAGAPLTVERVLSVLGAERAGVRLERGNVQVVFDSEDAAAEGLRALVAADVPVVEFAPAQSALEDTFLALGDAAAQHPPAQHPDAEREGGEA